MQTLISLTAAASMSPTALREYARTAPLQESAFAERYAHAKEAAAIGDTALAQRYLEAAKTSYRRAQEDEHGQLNRVRAVAAVVAERGAEQDATAPGGKSVVRLGMGRAAAIWESHWAR